MPIDIIAIWAAGKAVSALTNAVLGDVVKVFAKDKIKAWSKRLPARSAAQTLVASLRAHDTETAYELAVKENAFVKGYGKVVCELVEVIDAELQAAGVVAEQTEAWANDIQQLVRTEIVIEAFAHALTSSGGALDGATLQAGWQQLTELSPLPDAYDWDFVAKSFNRKLRTLREQDTDLRAVLQAQAAVEAASHLEQLKGVPPSFQLAKYRAELIRRYQTLELQSLDPYHDRVAQLHSVFVEQSVRECPEYAPQLLELPVEWRRRLLKEDDGTAQKSDDLEARSEAAEERLRAYYHQAARPVFEVLRDARHERMVVLGDPGSGKSTLLRYLAVEWAQQHPTALLAAAPLVLFIEFREYALNDWAGNEGKSLLRFWHQASIFHQFNQVELDKYLRANSGVVLLLDGLDEIFDETERKQALNDVQRFLSDYPNVSVLLTSRVIGYEKSQRQLNELNFRPFMLQDLEDDQIKDFLARWHQTTFGPDKERERQRKLAEISEAIAKKRAIRELAGNPLLLTLMAILNRQQELPRARALLYERAAEQLLVTWKTDLLEESFPELRQHGIGFDEKATMLRAVALHMQTNAAGERGNIIAAAELVNIVRTYLGDTLHLNDAHGLAKRLVNELRGRNFILCDLGNNHYAFVHRTFLEYFCATAYVQQFRANLDLDYLCYQVFGRYWHDEVWHETLCLIAGIIGQDEPQHVSQLVEYLLSRIDMSNKFPHVFLAARCCQELRQPSILGEAYESVLKALELPLRFKSFTHSLNITAFGLLTYFYSNLRWLKQCVEQDRDLAIREAAMQELVQNWKADPDALSILKGLATQDENPEVRLKAIKQLARGWKDDPATLALLKERATEDDVGGVRSVALQELARNWKADPDALSILKGLAAQDENPEVRLTTVKQLVRGWKDDPVTLALLKERATEDSEGNVRLAAMEAIAKNWLKHPNTLPFLRERVTNDPTSWVREEAKRYADEVEAQQQATAPS